MSRPAYHLIETAPPGAEPLTLEEVKLHLRITHDHEDTLLTSLIMTARMICEADTGLALITRAYSLWLDSWPATARRDWWDGVREGIASGARDTVYLPRPPLVAVSGILVYAENGTSVAFEAENYHTDTIRKPGRIVLRHGTSAPTAGRSINGIEIRYTAGFGTTPQSIPSALRQGMLQMIAHLYHQRGDAPETALHTSGAATLFQPYRLVRLA